MMNATTFGISGLTKGYNKKQNTDIDHIQIQRLRVEKTQNGVQRTVTALHTGK